ncbi:MULTISPECIES: hypothetical protein [unclassified Tolypothrix]|uniref:hypothetical protein n=1 Tax=unclassified Tolypothrix TaxID=2649714 RepID=UPI000B23A6D5|nr:MULTISPECIES: hypothetical protein [unclassified Tolypothrix]MBE9083282.1 hypothetical protein [Tolypothrix sp. LEGE 11397]UYD24420.1 hypothetical protein HGR01_23575 [Tolypothrix sp. PCC 7712]UYD33347.1 hypothetical protein HG267_31100 [Tolypothrix sp. PCC 7601]BAY90224.1 hypothetical protein NIES3275_22360 [Microchaete diplosiphon NIES-3275]
MDSDTVVGRGKDVSSNTSVTSPQDKRYRSFFDTGFVTVDKPSHGSKKIIYTFVLFLVFIQNFIFASISAFIDELYREIFIKYLVAKLTKIFIKNQYSPVKL